MNYIDRKLERFEKDLYNETREYIRKSIYKYIEKIFKNRYLKVDKYSVDKYSGVVYINLRNEFLYGGIRSYEFGHVRLSFDWEMRHDFIISLSAIIKKSENHHKEKRYDIDCTKYITKMRIFNFVFMYKNIIKINRFLRKEVYPYLDNFKKDIFIDLKEMKNGI